MENTSNKTRDREKDSAPDGKILVRVSARAMAEAVYRSGDLFAAGATEILWEAAQIHRDEQRRERPEAYRAEVSVSADAQSEHFLCHVTGRIDGLMQTQAGVIVQEIKTVFRDAPSVPESANPAYWAQALSYGHMLCLQRGLPRLTVQLLYIGRADGSRRVYERALSAEQLSEAFQRTASAYLDSLERAYARREALRASVRALSFPYPAYRAGQRLMAGAAYRAGVEGRRLFVQAPTGIGKTAAALFGAVQALAEGSVQQVFYLTAQGTNAAAALDFLRLLRGEGLDACVCRLCAKDELCPLPRPDCSDLCPYAQGYYDRAPAVVDALLTCGVLDGADIARAGEAAKVCPHALAMDLAECCPVVVGDFNYAFDPRAHLRRCFDRPGDTLLLVDEAHALPDRARAMFSAQLCAADFISLRRAMGRAARKGELYRATAAVILAFSQMERDEAFLSGQPLEDRAQSDGARTVAAQILPEELRGALEQWVLQAQNTLGDLAAPARTLFFDVRHFLDLCGRQEPAARAMVLTRGRRTARAALWCLDAKDALKQVLGRCRGALFFSATLSPVDFFKEQCGGDGRDGHLLLPSPYDPAHLAVLQLGTDVSFANRKATLDEVCEAIHAMAHARLGHYMAFFPSYDYARQGADAYRARWPEDPVRCTDRQESAENRAALIEQLRREPRTPLLVFAVLGGVFAQSVDLPGDALIGCAVVSVGLPGIDARTTLLRDWVDKNGRSGFDAALRYPGMNRVVQAAGRVIRGEADRGVLLLIDRRFAQKSYAALLPPHWRIRAVRDPAQIQTVLASFWGDAAD